MPVVVVLAFVLSAGHKSDSASPSASATGPLPGVTVAAPPTPSTATQMACVKVFAKLPVQLSDLAPRKTETDSSFVAAWGNPAIVLRCGVAKSSILGTAAATAQAFEINTVFWQPDLQKTQAVYTTVDRSVAIDVTVPVGADQPLAELATAIEALPKLCTGIDAAGNSEGKLPICK